MSISVIAGCPGTGKSTLSGKLAARSANGVHLQTDLFFDFIAHKVDPSSPNSNAQNQIVLEAWCAAALAYDKGGYELFIDGVIGPWWFGALKQHLGTFSYILLTADIETCLARVTNRKAQASVTIDMVRQMHGQFEAVEKSLIKHQLITANLTPDEVLHAYDLLPVGGLSID